MLRAPDNSVHPLTLQAWRTWLQAHHTRAEGVWLVSNKKGSGLPRFDYDDAVAQALCFGWIDSKPNKLDDTRSLLWFAPRKAKSAWSLPNKLRVQRLIDAGQMSAAGLAKVEAAQADGSWALLDTVDALLVPDDLRAALAAHAPAAQHFEAFPKSTKRGILEWIQNAKRADTRAARVTQTASLAQRNERANQWRPK
jgi:uncharacterized protein YdeI (YjbR/CyaY-like superfamily)